LDQALSADGERGRLSVLAIWGKVLYVLRREMKGSLFVGECFVYGIMDGSALLEQLGRCASAECCDLG